MTPTIEAIADTIIDRCKAQGEPTTNYHPERGCHRCVGGQLDELMPDGNPTRSFPSAIVFSLNLQELGVPPSVAWGYVSRIIDANDRGDFIFAYKYLRDALLTADPEKLRRVVEG